MDGAVFGEKYSAEDYGAIMNYARITPPAVKTNYVDIAGGNSAIDLTEAVGGIVYEDGNIEFKFTLFSWETAEKMQNHLHGRRMDIVLEREPEYCYDGRLSVTKIDQDGRRFELYLNARVKPYKCERKECIHTEILSGRDTEIMLDNDIMPVMPRITVEGNIQLTYAGIKYRLAAGVYQIPEVTLCEGLNRIRLTGAGTVKFAYRKGRLV